MVNTNGLHESLVAKLHPRNYTAMSGKMAALLGYVLGEDWTEPEFAELVVTSDGFVLARERGDVGCNNWIGSACDLDHNVTHLLDVAEVTEEERAHWKLLWHSKVDDWQHGLCEEHRQEP